MRSLVRTEEPGAEPLEVSDFAEFVPQKAGVDGGVLSDMIRTARRIVEARLGLSLIEQEWQLELDAADVAEVITLHQGPLMSVTSVKAYDEDGVESTVAATVYGYQAGDAARVYLKNGQTWPDALRYVAGLKITYRAGYGDDPLDVPDELRTLVKRVAAHLYKRRDGGMMQQATNAEGGDAVMEALFDSAEHLRRPYLA